MTFDVQFDRRIEILPFGGSQCGGPDDLVLGQFRRVLGVARDTRRAAGHLLHPCHMPAENVNVQRPHGPNLDLEPRRRRNFEP
jgi:hypothetical protein